MTRPHVFDAHVDSAKRWLAELGAYLDLSSPQDSPRVLRALRAGLHAIRDRLPANEAVDLSAQLPALIRGFYFDGWTLHASPHEIRDREDMLARVRRELGADPRLGALDVLRGVIHLLVTHVSPGELQDVVATLPQSIKGLWQDLAELDAAPARIHLEHRTGYSR